MFKISSQLDNTMLEKQVQSLFKATLSGGIANIGAAFLVFTLLNGSQHETSAIWLSVSIFVFSLMRILTSKHYISRSYYPLKVYLSTHVLLTFIIGMLWGVYIFLLHQPSDETARNVIYLINFGLIAGSITTLSTYRVAYLVYMLPQLIAIIAVYVVADTGSSNYIAIAVLLSGIFMMSASFGINRSHKKEIELTYNNKQLISDLNNEIDIRENIQIELEDSKRVLESTVDERTKDLKNTNIDLERVIEKKEKAEQSLQYLAYHDELTGLPNKNLLVDRINQSIKISLRDNQQMAILFLDLDRFKNINDSLGHTIGDKLLQEVSARIHKALRSHDTVSRNGGDEFVIVLEKLKSSNEAINVAKKVIKCVTDTFVIMSHKIHIGASVGISLYPNDGGNPLTLLRNADTAMYRAKQSGGNQLQFYDESMSNQLRDRLQLENELHNALEKNEFYMVYQPQLDCTTGITVGFESLIRWNNESYGEIGPDRFVPLLEETGLIYDVGDWIVIQVIEYIRSHDVNDVSFSINLSSLQCNSIDFVRFVKSEISEAGVDASRIEFEITESLLINDFDKTTRFLDELHSIGCTIALDDFGTGYTSMSYLARLPIDVIKIDKSLIRNIDSNASLQSIVKAIMTMSESLGMTNIIEGIETSAELAKIKSLKGNVIQGYLFSKPLKADEVEEWLMKDHNDNVKYLQ
jgi:diguanylate cyclase (GGDEF)-like protein